MYVSRYTFLIDMYALIYIHMLQFALLAVLRFSMLQLPVVHRGRPIHIYVQLSLCFFFYIHIQCAYTDSYI